jgi:ATP-dependent RNA helicase RhlE
LDETEVFVLDEADQMLDLGFVEPIRKVVKKLPARRQNLFFSATMPKTIGELANEILHNPQEVRVTPQATTVEKISQKVMHVEAGHKRDLLVELLAQREVSRAIVFTRTKHGADKLTQYLEKAGLSAAAIHGNKSQGQRERALAAFKAGKVQSLIATDIAARGIDVDSVSHVFQYELPNVPEAYVHRIGRTARAGAEGQAVALVDHSERNLLRDIERLTKLSIPAEDRRLDQSRPLSAPKSEADRDAGKAKKRNSRGRGGAPGHRGRRETGHETHAGGASAPSQARSGYGGGESRPRPAQSAQPARRSEWSPVDGEPRAKAAPRVPAGLKAAAANANASAGYGYRGPKRREA